MELGSKLRKELWNYNSPLGITKLPSGASLWTTTTASPTPKSSYGKSCIFKCAWETLAYHNKARKKVYSAHHWWPRNYICLLWQCKVEKCLHPIHSYVPIHQSATGHYRMVSIHGSVTCKPWVQGYQPRAPSNHCIVHLQCIDLIRNTRVQTFRYKISPIVASTSFCRFSLFLPRFPTVASPVSFSVAIPEGLHVPGWQLGNFHVRFSKSVEWKFFYDGICGSKKPPYYTPSRNTGP